MHVPLGVDAPDGARGDAEIHARENAQVVASRVVGVDPAHPRAPVPYTVAPMRNTRSAIRLSSRVARQGHTVPVRGSSRPPG